MDQRTCFSEVHEVQSGLHNIVDGRGLRPFSFTRARVFPTGMNSNPGGKISHQSVTGGGHG